MGVYYYIEATEPYVPSSLTYLPLVAPSISLVGFNVGLSAFPFVLIAEILPENVSHYAAGVCFFTNCLMYFLVVEIFYKMVHVFHAYGTFWSYAVAAFATFLVVLFCAPHTKGKTLADLQSDQKKRRGDKCCRPVSTASTLLP